MSNTQYKTPKPGGAKRIKEAYYKRRKRKPSKELLEILEDKSQKPQSDDEKVALPKKDLEQEL